MEGRQYDVRFTLGRRLMLATKILTACAGGVEKLYAEDVFSAYTYTGNGATQTITNGIDLAGKGGLVWLKSRTEGGTKYFGNNLLISSATGLTNSGMYSDATNGFITINPITSLTSSGFGLSSESRTNYSGDSFISWTFRRAAKFFDIVTYTGNGANRTIAHSLGSVPGMIMVKRTDTTGSWMVYHNSIANTENLVLNTTAAKATNATAWNSTTATASVFSLGTHADVNTSGGTYVAYVFGHDTSADGIIQCGSFTTDGSGNATVNLGWEPQYVMTKTSGVVGSWTIRDTSRAMALTQTSQLYANTSEVEYTYSGSAISPTATGFSVGLGNNSTQIYLAIRRPNKPPTLGTQVYNAIARTGTGAAATVTGVGFAPDLTLSQQRGAVQGNVWYDRLRGATKYLAPASAGAEGTNANAVTAFGMDGFSLGTEASVNGVLTLIHHFFKRAVGVFDVVCYTGTGAVQNPNHALSAVPELIITKRRSAVEDWHVYSSPTGVAVGYLNYNIAFAGAVFTSPTSSTFNAPTFLSVSGQTYVSYLFATKAGISKVGSYTGNGSSQTINCGFTTGARFVLIKRTDSTGDWYIWDSVRGIIAGNDPHLSLNTTAAEVTTDDSIDPDTTGFIVNQVAATNINVTSATYIYLAFA